MLIAGYTSTISTSELRIDGLGLAIAGLTLLVTAVVVAFSRRYMRADRQPRAYFATIGLLVASVLVVVFAGNLAVLAVGWVASGALLARLIGHAKAGDSAAARWRAQASFLIGDAALLGGLAILGGHAGSMRLDAALAGVASLPAWLATVAALLLVVAAAARCALPPFAGWLLSSMTAPTPVSALMHAGLVNAGGFLLIRFAPVLEAAPAARLAAVVLGLVAALYGVGVMMVRPDIKRSLAGSTVSQMGFMVLSCGLGAYAAALWHLIAHGLFKAWLFLGSGSAIGMKPGAGESEPAPAGTIAALTLALAGSAWLGGWLTSGVMLLALGGATAVAMLAGALAGRAPGKAMLALAIMALAVINGAGLVLAHAILGADGPELLALPVLLALLAGFLAAWVWQQRRLARNAPLPGALYVFLLNAGALPAPAQGTR